MDTKIEIKQGDCSSDDLASQNEGELFHKVIKVKSNNNAVLPDDNGCSTDVKTEIKLETSFPAFETVTCRNNCEMLTKIKIEEEALDSNLGSQKGTGFPSEDPLEATKNCNSDHEMDNKLEIKAEPLWLKTETPPLCGDIKDEDFPPVTPSGLCTQAVSGAVSDESPLPPSELSEMPTAEEQVLLGQSGECSEGGEMFTTSLFLGQKPLTQQGKRPHKCKACDKSFIQLSHLKMHNLVHEGKKPHKCSTCDKSFTLLANLKTHILIHEGKKPHKCNTCDKSFTQFSSLIKHNLIHEGKKPHKCKNCGKSFTQLSSLNKHTLIHEGKKPFHCSICDKSFTQLSNLKKHNLIHEGKKPHKCNTCDKSFTLLSHLKRHDLIHQGKKPHQCKTCNKSFTQLSHLKRHYLIHKDNTQSWVKPSHSLVRHISRQAFLFPAGSHSRGLESESQGALLG